MDLLLTTFAAATLLRTLRRLRRERGLNGDDVAAELEWSPAKISNIETARVTSHPNDIKLLLDLYEPHDEAERELLLKLCRESRTKGWWQHFGKALEPWANRYIGLADAAIGIRHFCIDIIYGPMQTEDYARAVISAGYPDSEHADVERGVRLRATRRQLLTGTEAPRLWAVIDEAALRRRIGGSDVMRGQLDHLVMLTELPHVVLQVLPYEVGAHPALGTDSNERQKTAPPGGTGRGGRPSAQPLTFSAILSPVGLSTLRQ